ncbi:MAG: ankyrin repeat domain-containing protein, partial [Armatimonadota bacterium]
MSDRHLPVHPDLDQLRNQAKDLLRSLKASNAAALAEMKAHHPTPREPGTVKLADAQLTLARSYGLPSWPRLVLACRMIGAIRQDDPDTIRQLIQDHPKLLHENARGTAHCNWGSPMSYAANLGKDRIIGILQTMGASDIQHAFERACLQGKLDTARRLHAMGARPVAGSVMGPCETQSGTGLALLLELGASLQDERGDRLAPVALILETYCRNPEGKHQCLEIVARKGIDLPDTPPMAVHRGRIDLLEAHL